MCVAPSCSHLYQSQTFPFQSLINSLLHLRDQSTPDLIRLAVTTTLQLIDLTTPSTLPSHDISLYDNKPQGAPVPAPTYTPLSPQSKSLATRFSRLSTLLSSSLLGTVIMYTPAFLPPAPSSAPDPDPFADPEHVDVDAVNVPEHPLQDPMPQKQSFNPTLVAAAQSLTPVLSALGIGGIRFLKGIVPVLAEWLALPLPIVTTDERISCDEEGTHFCHASKSSRADITLHLASLSSMSVLFHTCMPQIGGWSTTIVDAVGRCWIGCLDVEGRDDVFSKDSLYVLRKHLRETVVQLSKVCPSVVKVCAPLWLLVFFFIPSYLFFDWFLTDLLSSFTFVSPIFINPLLTSLYHSMNMLSYWHSTNFILRA